MAHKLNPAQLGTAHAAAPADTLAALGFSTPVRHGRILAALNPSYSEDDLPSTLIQFFRTAFSPRL